MRMTFVVWLPLRSIEIRDQAREEKEKLGLKKEFDQLNKMIGAILATPPHFALTKQD